MGFINLGRLNIRKRNSCASALVSLSDVHPPSVYKSHILNGPINKLYIIVVSMAFISWYKELSLYFIIHGIMVHSDTVTDIISILGHRDLDFTVQCYCLLSGNIFEL